VQTADERLLLLYITFGTLVGGLPRVRAIPRLALDVIAELHGRAVLKTGPLVRVDALATSCGHRGRARPAELRPGRAAAVVERVLVDPALKAGATKLATEVMALPSRAQAVDALVGLARAAAESDP
jgi:UDP:flavonoid glycosyltransferase YjiC (YdhE family)